MKLADLDANTLATIQAVRWDRIIEKHEGPATWASVLQWYDPEFMIIDGRAVLLPIAQSQHANITILRTIWSENHRSLTLFLQDTTYDNHWAMSGFMAVCDRLDPHNFYLAILYHEWFIIDTPNSQPSSSR